MSALIDRTFANVIIDMCIITSCSLLFISAQSERESVPNSATRNTAGSALMSLNAHISQHSFSAKKVDDERAAVN